MTSGRQREVSMPRVSDALAIAAACIFVFLASYRIELPGLYMDELDFVNAAQGAPDNTMIHMRLGSVPLFIMPYLGALKAWIYTPIFGLFGVSALTIRLPAILIAAATLLIFYQLMRAKLGPVWATIGLWIMMVDPANLFPSRLDWGPTVLMHFFQAAILALWFSYRNKPELWKIGLILICFGLGFFDKFNFIWLVLAFLIGISLCYPDNLKHLWVSFPRFARRMALITVLIVLGAMLYFTLPLLLHFHPPRAHTAGLEVKWNGLVTTLSGVAVARFIFGSSSGMIPLPLLAFAFLAKSLYTQLATENLRRLAALLFGAAAVSLLVVNVHNTAGYLSYFRTNSHYSPRGSPEIYTLSRYINEHGLEAKSVISVDWGLHNQLHALAPKKLRQRMHDCWPMFKNLANQNQERQAVKLNYVFPEGKTLALAFAPSKETFPETRQNFLASLAARPELKSRLVREFWSGGEKIYELYEVVRSPHGT